MTDTLPSARHEPEDLLALTQPSEPLLFRSGAECLTVGATFFGRDEAGKACRVVALGDPEGTVRVCAWGCDP